jgi:hypothetical protein
MITPGAMQSILELVQAATFIFSGTVLELAAPSVPIGAANQRLITVRLDQSLRVDPVLGDLSGETITVAVDSTEQFEVGQQALFFANSAAHGSGIVVREVAHIDVGQADLVAAQVAQLTRRNLLDRLQDAVVVVDATITNIDPPGFTFDQHDGLWAAAHMEVTGTLKGTAPSPPVLYFATAQWPPFDRMPRFTPGQAGIFILHVPLVDTTTDGGTLPAGGLVADDAADFQEPSETARIEQLLAALE